MKKRVRRTKEEAQRLILDVTAALVEKHGPSGFRVSDVASQAEMHVTNIFHHFKSRDGLLQALVSRAIDDGATRALQALGESLGAPPEEHEEALAKVLDVIQDAGTGRLYSWLILAGLVGDAQTPSLARLVPALRAWRAAMFPEQKPDPDDRELRAALLLIAVFWLGEAVGGAFLAKAVGYENPEDAIVAHRRWLARVLYHWMKSPPARGDA